MQSPQEPLTRAGEGRGAESDPLGEQRWRERALEAEESEPEISGDSGSQVGPLLSFWASLTGLSVTASSSRTARRLLYVFLLCCQAFSSKVASSVKGMNFCLPRDLAV